MVDDNELKRLGGLQAPAPGAEAKARALAAAMQAFDEKNFASAPQGSETRLRLTDRAWKIWREMMQKKLLAAPALTALVALPIAGYATFYLMEESPFRFGGEQVTDGPVVRQDATSAEPAKEKKADAEIRESVTQLSAQPEAAPKSEAPANYAAPEAELSRDVSGLVAPAPAPAPAEAQRGRVGAVPGTVATSKMMADQAAGAPPDRAPAAGRGKPRSLRGIQDQPGALCCDRSGLDLLDRRRHGLLFLRAPLAEGRFPAAARHGARRGDGQLLPLRLEGS